MIFAVFIVLVLGLFIAILNLLPAVTAFPIDATSAFAYIIGIAKGWDLLFPIHEMIFLLISVIIPFEVAVWVWHTLRKVASFVRGHNDS